MPLFYYQINIEHVEYNDKLLSVTVDGTIYTPAAPFVLSAQNAPAITSWLQTTIPTYLWLSNYSTDVNTGLSYLNIYTDCVSASTPSVMSAQILFSGVPRSIPATNENCGYQSCAGITASIDGVILFDCNQQCISFTDTTGVYGTSNLGGYGTPNYPAIADINSVTFTLLDANGTTLGTPFVSAYRPTAEPFATVCLTAANFGVAFVSGSTYQLKYTITTTSSITCSALQIPFVMPCCGAVLPSGLQTNVLYLQDPEARFLTFVDETYAYSSTNPTGYGTPNPGYSNISRTEFVVTTPDNNVVSFDIGYLPNALTNTAVITPANLGYGPFSRIPDGVYKIVFNIYAIPYSSECLLATQTVNTLLFANTWRCQQKQMIAALNGCDLDFKTQVYADRMELNALVAASVGNIDCVQGVIERLFEKCMINCPTCNDTM